GTSGRRRSSRLCVALVHRMSLRSQVFTASGTWRSGKGVSQVRVMHVGGGGGGDATLNFQDSKGGGGSAEFWVNFPINVTPDTFYAVTVGLAGAGAISAGGTSTAATSGGASAFQGFSALGGN